MRKFFRKIHLWLSIPFGVIITLTCFSGAMLVFEKEVNEWIRPELYFVKQVKLTSIPVEELLEKVATTLPDSVSVLSVSISSDPNRAYQISLSKPHRSSIYIDQYTGEVTGKNERSSFFMFMFRMHRWLLDSMNPGNKGVFWGKMIVGVSTFVFVIVLISGIVIWWPRTRKAFKNSFKIARQKGLRRFLYDLHVVGGMYAFLFLLAMSLTGLTWSFSWYRTAFYNLFGVEMTTQSQNRSVPTEKSIRKNRDISLLNVKSEGSNMSPFVYWQQVYDKLSTQDPQYKLITISSGNASVAHDFYGNQRAADRYSFNVLNGEIHKVDYYREQASNSKIRGWIYSVHVGSWGGIFTRLLSFFAALLGASLPLTGYYLFIKKSLKKKRRENVSDLSA